MVEAFCDALTRTFDQTGNAFDQDEAREMLAIRGQRKCRSITDTNGDVLPLCIVGVSLDLPVETTAPDAVLDTLAAALQDTLPIVHAVKFEDPWLQADLAKWAAQIFALEMKLRRVLSYVYLHAYQSGNPYDLLREESVQPMGKPSADQMRAAAENQFFHLTFSQYIGLNQRPEIKVAAMLEMVRGSAEYDAFRAEVLRTPVADENDASVLAGLKERMDAVERMRNCIAHNRRPSAKIIQNYENARPLVDTLLDGYLERWEES